MAMALLVSTATIVTLLYYHQILTKDAVTVSVEAVIYYRISDASAVVNQLENHR